MRFLSIILTFTGYALLYASVAGGGKFATEPWAGLFSDAYTGEVFGPSIILGTTGPKQDFSGRTKKSVGLVPHETIPTGATIGSNGQLIFPRQSVRPRG